MELKWCAYRFSPTTFVKMLGYMFKICTIKWKKSPRVIALATLSRIIHFLGSWQTAGEWGRDRAIAGLPCAIGANGLGDRKQSESRVFQAVVHEASAGALESWKILSGAEASWFKNKKQEELCWRSSGWDSMLPLQGASQIPGLGTKIRHDKLHGQK